MNICHMCVWLLGLEDGIELPGVRGTCKLPDVGVGKVSFGRAISTLSDEPSLQVLNCRDFLKIINTNLSVFIETYWSNYEKQRILILS